MTVPVRLRPEIAALPPYRQGKQADAHAFKLSSNENPFEPLPAVLDVLRDSLQVNRYPDGAASGLRSVLAERFGVGIDEVHAGAGSISILSQLLLATAQPGDEVVYAWRSFEAYPGLVTVTGATSVQVPNRADGSHDLEAMAAAVTDATRLVIVCSPNNPTGEVVSTHDFERFMAAVPESVLVVLDEAYAEFVTDDTAVQGESLTEKHPNLVVLRTFSKAYGLAGLRIGYAIGPAYVLDAARSTAIALSVTAMGQQAAIASLEHEEELLERVSRIVRLRDQVRQALIDQGWDVPRAQGNFVWLPTGEHTARAAEVFDRAGIVVRAFAPEGIRISIGESASVDKLLGAAQEVVRSL
ncbi:histidinol-phosphate aminotransferase [Frondihabitans sp. PhB188]|uniref:histidinol-phosphate transaminase n=1 Tax=Frondihabitans sp. PhB188 TaxID=2485200 RepID=UPI000F49DE90|nr:histidinol-phosphate transaminase [Frondihabitans sp. PhB188]ROQ40061.1 histidinol-phosphate aminotransferase [Frondihabitans sp. PhB188]